MNVPNIDPSKTTVVLGPPGVGKTHRLLTEVEDALANGVSPKKIGYVSFTKKATEEAKSRASKRFSIDPEELVHFRTIHSFAFKHVGMRRDQVLGWRHLNELGKMLGLEFKGKGSSDDDGDFYGMGAPDRLLFLEGLARNKLMPLKQVWNDAMEDEVDFSELDRFARALTQYKKSRTLFDFNDMVEKFNSSDPRTMPQLDLLVVDEVQDLSLLQWKSIELLAQSAKKLIVGGDDCQCHPPGEKIFTSNRGAVPIESLVSRDDRLIYWRRDTHLFHGWNQFPGDFEMASRHFDGKLVCVNVDGVTTKVTPDHKMIVRFVNMSQDIRCVYVMRQGNNYRVGQCQMFNSDNAVHFWQRVRYERGDAIWILKITLDRNEAFVLEQVISAKYGLPQFCFTRNSTGGMPQSAIDEIFTKLDTRSAAEKCLSDFSLLIEKPFYTSERAREKSGGTSICTMEAVNLIPDIMVLPRAEKFSRTSACVWEKFSVHREYYTGPVFSLNVKHWHTYLVNNIAINNCIYSWSGANVDSFINLRGKSLILDQSYRVPASVHGVADSISDRIVKKRERRWRPRNEEGAVNWVGNFDDVDMSKGKWLVMARNAFLLAEVEDYCMSQGYSFHSTGRDPLKSKSLSAIKTWETLRKGRDESAENVLATLLLIPARWCPLSLVRRLKADEASRMYGLPELRSMGLGTTAIWHEALEKISPAERDYFLAARRQGEALLKEPRINLSTIHASKGGECDNVLLLTDVSYRSYDNANNGTQEAFEDEQRVFYVAVTRARETLNIVQPRTDLCFNV